jgi:predicted extracellular nuclease
VAFAAHFRSKLNDDPGRRQAEARAARDIVRASAAANRNALVVMAGDLNDTPDSPPLQDLMAGGHLLRVAEELGDQDYTYDYLGDLTAIDHVLLATEATGAEFLPGTATIFRGRNTTGFGGSDHAAVRATFLFPEP